MLSVNANTRLASAIRQRGVGLIEVQIALVILSIGFLATSNMQLQGMRNGQMSGQRSQALFMITDMMDRMISNPDAVANGDYDSVDTGTVTQPDCAANACTSAQQAALDIFDWSANLQSLRSEMSFTPLLPQDSNGDPALGTIRVQPDGTFILKMSWEGFIDGATATETVEVSFRP